MGRLCGKAKWAGCVQRLLRESMSGGFVGRPCGKLIGKTVFGGSGGRLCGKTM